MAGLELRYESIQECIYEIQKLSTSYPAVERAAVRGEGQNITELEQTGDVYASFYEAVKMLTEDTAKYLDCVIREFKKADKKKIEIS